MSRTSLVVMAAGIGSRFGGGIKQLAPVGPGGQIIMDYSIRDAVAAGFDRVVFIIRKDLEADFREVIGRRMEEKIDVAYAFQELDDLPAGFRVPEGRVKPWGTGAAIRACRGIVNEPFCVINADDYYGREPYRLVHDFLQTKGSENADVMPMCMAGFRLKNTLSENGSVTRGICEVDGDGKLLRVVETFDIFRTEDGAAVKEGETLVPIDPESLTSMNMWGLPANFLDMLEDGFTDFLKAGAAKELKSEYLLPAIIDDLVQTGRATVDVLDTDETWFGVTYQEDKESVVRAFAELTEKGIYPETF